MKQTPQNKKIYIYLMSMCFVVRCVKCMLHHWCRMFLTPMNTSNHLNYWGLSLIN